jgi:hypothetical protein
MIIVFMSLCKVSSMETLIGLIKLIRLILSSPSGLTACGSANCTI